MIEITDKTQCCGCNACAAICPKQCITMIRDEEGFLYPAVNKDECVDCNACIYACPILHPVEEIPTEQIGYLVQHKDETIRMESSSGGAFSAISCSVIEQGGVVFGAAYDKNFQVIHKYAETQEEIQLFRNSKYVQSTLQNCFHEVKAFLEAERLVCFSGTPCQIEGLVRYLKKTYKNLLLVDIVCHAVGSPMIWEKYLEYQNVIERGIDSIRFRDKYYGYKYSTMTLIRDGKKIYHAGAQKDPMLRAFFSDICDRPACYQCAFKKRYRISDITLWDCFSVYDFDKKMDDDKGTTRVLCHSEKGANAINAALKITNYRKISPDRLVKGSKEMFSAVKMNPKRECFFSDALNMTGRELFETYFPITFTVKLKTQIRTLLVKTGMYRFAKKALNKARGR